MFDLAKGAPFTLIVLTVTSYAAFLLAFGASTFHISSYPGCSIVIVDCAITAGDVIGDLIGFVTFGGLSSPLDPAMQLALILGIGVWWATVVADTVAEAV